MADESQYFYEDEVYKINKKGNIEFGMVLENAELISSDESDVEEGERMKKGFIRVYWHTTGNEEVVPEKKVGLADRSLMPGDVVRRLMKGQDTQRGYCRHMHVTACVQVTGTNQIINNISSSDLVPIEDFVPDIAVCLDSWVGSIKVVHSKLHLRLPDKTTVVISDPETNGFDSVFTDKKHKDPEYGHHSDYYPGQVLWGPMSVLTDLAHWKLHKDNKNHIKHYKNKIVKVVVEQVEVESVGVHWQCRAYSKEGSNADKEQPKMLLTNEDLQRLKLLNVFEPCTLQVGDRNRYVLKAEDEIITRDQWKRSQKRMVTNSTDPPQFHINKISRAKLNDDGKKFGEEKSIIKNSEDISQITDDGNVEWYTDTSDGNDSDYSNSSAASTGTIKKHPPTKSFTKSLHKKKMKKPKKAHSQPQIALTSGSNLIVETVSTMSTADVVWQDGSIELGIPSTELFPIHHLDDQEFFPGDFVIENREDACMRVYGVIQCMDHAGRTARVKWFKTYTSSENPQPTLITESEVSVYDLKDHPDFQYRPGTVVIRVANFIGEDQNSTAGQVLDNYPEGRVRVCWAEGHTSMCWPQDLYKVGDYDSDEGELWDDATSEDGSWMTDSDEPTASDVDKFETEDESLKPKLAANIEKARVAMSRLEEIFTQNPSLQTADVMKKLLEVYKDCRYLDRLMGTNFFDESYFEGLIERVRERGRANTAQRVQDQLDRLFTPSESDNNVSELPGSLVNTGECLAGRLVDLEGRVSNTASTVTTPSTADGKPPCFNVCVKLCSLILGQLLEAHAEVMKRFGDGATSRMSLSEAAKSPGSSSSSTTSQAEQPISTENTTSQTSPPPEGIDGGEDNERLKNLLVNGSMDVDVKVEENDVSLDAPPQAGIFSILETAPNSHKYKLAMFHPNDPKSFFKTLRNEIKLLKTSLPPGIYVKAFEDRMDLLSVMIRGPEKTPYEGGLFFFDFQLSQEYPKTAPHCHYISFCSDRLNPNLYEDGKVCISLLGTWSGKGTEVWTNDSNLLQILISIQGLILVMEPYFNEAGYEKQKGSQQGKENSRMYNEMVLLKLVQSMTKIALHPSPVFHNEILDHLRQHAYKLCDRLESWLEISEQYNQAHPLSPTTPTTFKQLQDNGTSSHLPEFPLIPASRGFCLTLRKTLVQFKQVINEKLNPTTTQTINDQPSNSTTQLNQFSSTTPTADQ